MDRRQLLFGASALGLVTNLNLNHPLIAQVGTAVMGRPVCPKCGKVRLSGRERAGLRGPVKTCSDLIEGGRIKSINTDFSPDGRLLRQRQVGILDNVDVTEFYHGQRKKSAGERVCARPDVTDQFHYDEQGRKTRVRTTSVNYSLMIAIYSALVNWRQSEWRMLQGADQFDYFIRGGTVNTRYNENDQPIESLIRDANGELLAKINQNYKNGRLISETLVIVRLRETPREFEFTRQMQEQFPANTLRLAGLPEIDNEQARAFLGELQAERTFLLSHPVETSYTYDADDRVIRRLTQMGDFEEEESKTFNEQGDLDWTRTLMIRNGIADDERSEFRYLYQYDSHGNWTERTTINCSRPDDPNTQRRTLAYY
jgi:hypothetical protein